LLPTEAQEITIVPRQAPRVAFAALALTTILCGCTIRLISEYDPETDRGVSALQSEVTAQLATLEQLGAGPGGQPVSPDCKFENFKETYAQLAAQAHVLKVRNEVRDKNELTTTQLGLLEKNLGEQLVSLHRDADGQCMTRGTVLAARETLDQLFRAILKLEIAKQKFRGG
jgi:hypothetical protein